MPYVNNRGITINDDADKRAFAGKLLEWFNTMQPGQHDWAEALLSAALDQTQGDTVAALALARQEFDANPDGGDEANLTEQEAAEMARAPDASEQGQDEAGADGEQGWQPAAEQGGQDEGAGAGGGGGGYGGADELGGDQHGDQGDWKPM